MTQHSGSPKAGLLGEETSEADVKSCLARAGYGILGLVKDGDAYTVPLSFGYDDDIETLYFLLAFEENSRKATFIETTDTASFVVVDANLPDSWESVMITGTLEVVPEDSQTAAFDTVVR